MDGLSIVVMNWRDIRNPDAGGAEVFTHEIAKRLVEWGDSVSLVTSRFPGAPREEVIDGVRVVRVGNKYTVYRRARTVYLQAFRGRTDVVIDEINTIPFLTPRYVDDGRFLAALIHQVARESWAYETPFPVSVLGQFLLEDRWLRHYLDVPTLTVSPSARHELVSMGFRDVSIIPEGISTEPLSVLPQKEPEPTFLFVGRLKKVKLPRHALEAFRLIQQRHPTAQLWVVGDGYLRKKLERHAPPNTRFFGRIPEAKKLQLMRRAHVLLYPAVREGWGLSITEANAMGTPAVGYDVPGLRDSIRHGETGLLASPGDVRSLSEGAESLISDVSKREYLATNGLRWAREFSWTNSAKLLQEYLHGRNAGS